MHSCATRENVGKTVDPLQLLQQFAPRENLLRSAVRVQLSLNLTICNHRHANGDRQPVFCLELGEPSRIAPRRRTLFSDDPQLIFDTVIPNRLPRRLRVLRKVFE